MADTLNPEAGGLARDEIVTEKRCVLELESCTVIASIMKVEDWGLRV